MAKRTRRAVIAAIVALAVIVAVVALGLSGSGGHGSTSATPSPPTAATEPQITTPLITTPTTVAVPTAADVAAARACQAFTVYIEDAEKGQVPAAAGRALIEDAAVLLAGATKATSEKGTLPKWATLGSDLLAAADDVVSNKVAAFKTDGAAAGAQCRTVSAAAARAGGFVRTGSSSP